MKNSKRKDLNNSDKLEVLDMLEKKIPRAEISKHFNICNAAVTNILKNENEIKNDCLNRDKKRNRDCKVKYLYEWFLEKRRMNIPINGPLLSSKAIGFSAMCMDESCKTFKPTNGCLGRFKKRHNISWQKI